MELNERNETYLMSSSKEKIILLLKAQRKYYVSEKACLKVAIDEQKERNKTIYPKMQERLEKLALEIQTIDEDIKKLEG
jgi:hypothetical protein